MTALRKPLHISGDFVLVPRAEYDRMRALDTPGLGIDETLDAIDREIGRRAKLARTHRGLTVAALAGLLRIAPEVLTAVESGSRRMSSRTLLRLLKACGLPADWTPAPRRKGAL